MSEIDQQFIEYVVKSLVGKPDAVQIERTIDEKGVLLKLTVDPDDLGRVIGKRGATAQSLRTLLRALGTKNDARYNLKIVDNGPSDGQGSGSDTSEPTGKSASSDDSENKDDGSDDEAGQPEKDQEPAEAETSDDGGSDEPEPEEETPSPEDETGDRLARARKELADLDDLDV